MFLRVDYCGSHTTRLLAVWRVSFTDSSRLLQVNVPVLLLAILVLECECEDCTGLLNGIFAVGFAGESSGDRVESCGGGEGGCEEVSAVAIEDSPGSTGDHTFLKRHYGDLWTVRRCMVLWYEGSEMVVVQSDQKDGGRRSQ